MADLVLVRVSAPPETAIKKLARAKIAAFRLKKQGVHTTFWVGYKTLEKVFAIFAHPCYNVCVIKYGAVRSAFARAAARAGALVGAAAFVAVVVAAQRFVFRIDVTGSGAHLAPQVVAILSGEGISVGRPCGKVSPSVTARIMALPAVTFCSVQKRGTAVIVDVECGSGGISPSPRVPLLSPVSGVVERLVALCGTPRAEEGQSVSVGDELISPCYAGPSGEEYPCLCAGYAHIRVRASICVAAEEESDSGLAAALAAAELYAEGAEVLSHRVRAVSQGVVYQVDFTYIYTASINMQ